MYRLRMYAVLLSLAFLTTTATGDVPRKNQIGFVIGATETPSVGETRGGTIYLNSSLALGAEYDRRLVGKHMTLYAGADFLASPADVKIPFLCR